VVNGDFVFSFRLPGSVHADFGTGRMNYYAQDTATDDEAQGYFENFTVGDAVQPTGIDLVNGLTPVSLSVTNFPNPVKTHTQFVVTVNQPENVIGATVELYDISGSKIWSVSQPSIDNLTWDLVTNSGQKVKAGVYLYQVKLKMTNSEIMSVNNKMIIVD